MTLATTVATRPATVAATHSDLVADGRPPRARQYAQDPANCPATDPMMKPPMAILLQRESAPIVRMSPCCLTGCA